LLVSIFGLQSRLAHNYSAAGEPKQKMLISQELSIQKKGTSVSMNRHCVVENTV
jgi:hypothetical protein